MGGAQMGQVLKGKTSAKTRLPYPPERMVSPNCFGRAGRGTTIGIKRKNRGTRPGHSDKKRIGPLQRRFDVSNFWNKADRCLFHIVAMADEKGHSEVLR